MNQITEEIIDEIVLFNNFRTSTGIFFDERFITKSLYNVLKNNVQGDVVELGCYVGESSKIIRRTLDYVNSTKNFYVYDSFEGLPKTNLKYDGFKEGDLKCGPDQIIENFFKNNLKLPIIGKSWFKDIRLDQLPNQVSFAFFDGDFYDSIMDSFEKVWPILSPGGIVVVHDYFSEALKGAKKATDVFLEDKQHRIVCAHKDMDAGNDIIEIYKY